MFFQDIIGHDRPVAILKRALNNNALAHAYLFSGESGIGKRLTALSLAAAVNCSARSRDGGCGVCSSCRRIASGNHPDVSVLAPETDEIKIDQIRAVQEVLALKAFEGSRKVLIVDGAEAMNDAAANAFLKTLEEPPGDSLIILLTAMPQSLLPTIRSRCQELKFQPLPRRLIAEALQKQRGISEADAWFLAALSRGSIGKALGMDVDAEREARQQFTEFIFQLKSLRRHDVLGLAEDAAKDREKFERLIELGAEQCRDMLVFAITGDEQLLVSKDRCRESHSLSIEVLLRDFELFKTCRMLLERRVSPQLAAENLFLKLRHA